MAVLRRPLDVFGVVIAAADHDEIFQPAVRNSSPSIWKPRSPVRRNGPFPVAVPVLARNAEKVSSVSAGLPK